MHLTRMRKQLRCLSFGRKTIINLSTKPILAGMVFAYAERLTLGGNLATIALSVGFRFCVNLSVKGGNLPGNVLILNALFRKV